VLLLRPFSNAGEMVDNEREPAVSRREAIKKAAIGAGAAGLVWSAPKIEGLSLRPSYAAAMSVVGTELVTLQVVAGNFNDATTSFVCTNGELRVNFGISSGAPMSAFNVNGLAEFAPPFTGTITDITVLTGALLSSFPFISGGGQQADFSGVAADEVAELQVRFNCA